MARNGMSASFLTRLARDARGNTIALAAAAMIPLAGLIGGGVDMSRLYLTKTRLQQACDAGALAGRKAMGSGSWTTSGAGNSDSRANELFAVNFKSNAYGTGTLTKSYSESNGTVTGTASVTVPMTIMRVFGMTQRTLAVSCTAKMEIPNTDVMFVLDVTGSMNCAPGVNCYSSTPQSGAKIIGLKSAVKCFYEALLKVNTAEVCGSDPTATSYTGTPQIRIGFMPYSVNVNVGKLLKNDYFANSWPYQTRQGAFYSTGAPAINAYDETASFDKKYKCNNWAISSNTSGFPSTTTTPASFTATTTDYTFVSYNSGTQVCTRRVNQETVVYTRDDANGTYFHTWIYKQATLNVSDLKAGGSSWNSTTRQRIGDDGDYENIAWDGCIEERQTVKNTDGTPAGEWDTIPAAAYDMNIDMIPGASDDATKWGPMLEDAVWARYSGSSNTLSDVITVNNLSRNRSYYCTTEAKKLQTWYTPSGFVSYVDSLDPEGNTYHDIGMLWGARFISPTGIFASENAATPTGGNIQRHIIFMTDGDTMTSTSNYTAYGVGWWDRRQTSYAPTDSNLDDILDARLTALCTAIKNKNITLWVVSYGGNVNATTEARLSACATPGKFFSAANTSTLISNFKQIASEIAELRLTS